MTDLLLYTRVSTLPENFRKGVFDFIEFLITKSNRPKSSKKFKERKFGCGKGFFKMSAGFDEPLDDFQDYI